MNRDLDLKFRIRVHFRSVVRGPWHLYGSVKRLPTFPRVVENRCFVNPVIQSAHILSVRKPLKCIPLVRWWNMVISFVPNMLRSHLVLFLIVKISRGSTRLKLGGTARHFLHPCNISRIINVKMMMPRKHGYSFLLNIHDLV